MPRVSILAAVTVQLLLGVAAIVALALTPPDRGAMLMVPTSATLADTVNAALSAQAAVVGAGPLPRSLVVYGDRAAIERRLAGHGTILLAAPSGICGSAANRQGAA